MKKVKVRAPEGNHLSVWIKPSKELYSGSEPIIIEYLISNELDQDIFVVEGLSSWVCMKNPEPKLCDSDLEPCFINHYLAETPLPDNMDIYSYLPPNLKCVTSGEIMKQITGICLPLRYSRINPQNEIEEIITPVTGLVKIMISIGYGLTNFIVDRKSKDVISQFLEWQQVIESNSVEVVVR